MKELFESHEVARMRRNRGYLGLAASPFLLTLFGLVAALVTHRAGFLAMVPHPLILGLAALGWVWNRNPKPTAEPTTVRANRDGMRIGAEFVPHARVRDAYVLPRRPKPAVRLNRRGVAPPIEIVVENEAEGRRLLHAMGFDASQTVAHFRVMSRAMAHRGRLFAAYVLLIVLGGLLGSLGAALHIEAPLVSLLGIVFLSIAAVALAPSRLDVGADGILIRWLGRRRFIDYAEVELVTRFDAGFGRSRMGGVDLLLKSGESVRVPVGTPRWADGRIDILEERIKEAMDTFSRGHAEADASVLGRGERALSDWITALRSIGTGANAAHRIAPVPGERLWRILEDASASHAARAAAAVALGPTLDDDGRARVATAAEATAAPNCAWCWTRWRRRKRTRSSRRRSARWTRTTGGRTESSRPSSRRLTVRAPPPQMHPCRLSPARSRASLRSSRPRRPCVSRRRGTCSRPCPRPPSRR